MKNLRLKMSIGFLVIVFITMTLFVLRSKAEVAASGNIYDDNEKTTEQIIDLYHKNTNDTFNTYIKMMMTNLKNIQDDPNAKAFHEDGSPFTAAQCMADANNYSTFCVAANLLGGYSAQCPPPAESTNQDLIDFCSLDKSSPAFTGGYLNYIQALDERTTRIFDTIHEQTTWNNWIDASSCALVPDAICSPKTEKDFADKANATLREARALIYSERINMINNEKKFAKQALDQTLSAYDQLRTAWPIHLKYTEVYSDLEKYRDKIVNIRHATDVFPKKFIDLATTSCT